MLGNATFRVYKNPKREEFEPPLEEEGSCNSLKNCTYINEEKRVKESITRSKLSLKRHGEFTRPFEFSIASRFCRSRRGEVRKVSRDRIYTKKREFFSQKHFILLRRKKKCSL
jgi:hypothetical protein